MPKIDTTPLSEEAQDVATELARSMKTTKEEAFRYMIESATRGYRSAQRVNYKTGGRMDTDTFGLGDRAKDKRTEFHGELRTLSLCRIEVIDADPLELNKGEDQPEPDAEPDTDQ